MSKKTQLKNLNLSADVVTDISDDISAFVEIQRQISSMNELDADTATDKDTISCLNTLLKIFKHKTLPLASILLMFTSLSMHASPVISPDGVQTNIAVQKNDIPGNRLMYTADAVEVRLKQMQDLQSRTNRYPMFVIDLNDTLPNYVGEVNELGYVVGLEQNEKIPYSTTEWCEFELKATTNNFLSEGNDVHATLQVTNSAGKVVATVPKDTKGIGMD